MRNNDPFSDLIRSIEENLQRDGGWVPPEQPQEPRRVPQGRPLRVWWLLIPILLFVLWNVGMGFLTDSAWYDSLGYRSVFLTRLSASAGLFVGGFLFAWLFITLNILLARRLEPFGLINTPPEQIASAFGVRVPAVLIAAAAVFALLMGLSVAGDWQQLLLYWNQVAFDRVDPLFGFDVSFFVFTLPIWEMLRGWLLWLLAATIAAVAVTAGVGWRGWNVRPPIRIHLAVLGALPLLLVAGHYRLEAFELVYSQRGPVYGASYTDVHAQLPAYNILALVSLAAAVLLVVVAFLGRGWRAIGIVIAAWVLVTVGAGSLYPGLVQRFQVAPNELTLERPYIEAGIASTRSAFNLDKIEKTSYTANRNVSPQGLASEPASIRNVRLWDYRPLLQTYNQVQALRQFYAFHDVDVDRYLIDGEVEQVMVSARELSPDRLNADAQTWVNLKLIYTHGYGAAISPAVRVTADGLPEFYAKDLPVTGSIPITRPEVYFGELTNDYVIGRTEVEEFNYPQATGFATTRFSADTGIPMTFGNRLLFALRFADINLVLNQDISADSQLLWRRNIMERVRLLAPFLSYDSDPYIVAGRDGNLYWIIDAYTTSDRYPYSEPYRESINYIRNPIKVVVNAYDGVVNFYVVDESEPVAAAYRKIFPALFKPLAEIPPAVIPHLRYPTDLFSVQAEKYRTFHMTNPGDFYNKEDVWAWPQEIFGEEPVPVEPYYVLMQLPGSDELDYIQILPFTPANRENMVAWMAAQSTLDRYGEIIVYEFGKDSLFFGPQQIEARIDQDPVISAQLSLWNQQGSNVIRGNLLVIPIADSLLYVEPLYLQAQNGKIPELKRVIVASADRVVMAENLGLALILMFGRETVTNAGLQDLAIVASAGAPGALPPTDTGGETAGDTTEAGADNLAGVSLQDLVVAANLHYTNAQNELRAGNWAGYGAEMEALQAVIEQMMLLSGVEVEASAEPAAPVEPTAPAELEPKSTPAAGEG
jgi:uncharacterized membrane protein (UPF0182 family)